MEQQRSQRPAPQPLDSAAPVQAMTGPAHGRLAGLASSLNGDAPVQRKRNATGLPDNLKRNVESLTGSSLDHVRVHYRSPLPATVGALAYTQGHAIHVGPGQERHLPHEAIHAVQQAQGRVKATGQAKGGTVPLNADRSLEHEADHLGAKATQMKADPAAPAPALPLSMSYGRVIQRAVGLAEQVTAAANVAYILRWTTAAETQALRNRVTFGPAPLVDDAAINNFAAYNAYAQAVEDDIGYVFNIVRTHGASAYNGDRLDGPVTGNLQAHRNAIAQIRQNNDAAVVQNAKRNMVLGVAKGVYVDEAMGYNAQALRNAPTLAQAQAALTAWENHKFQLDRPRIIGAAKKGAHNGYGAAATVWNGITAQVGGHNTHLTVYNNDIGPFGPFMVTALTNQAQSNGWADNALPTGGGNQGVHVTAEVNGQYAPNNPRVFGNPANAGRYYNANAAAPAAQLAAQLDAGLATVRGYVWADLVHPKVLARP
jgi:hypothetical protein